MTYLNLIERSQSLLSCEFNFAIYDFITKLKLIMSTLKQTSHINAFGNISQSLLVSKHVININLCYWELLLDEKLTCGPW